MAFLTIDGSEVVHAYTLGHLHARLSCESTVQRVPAETGVLKLAHPSRTREALAVFQTNNTC
jgi:hypothetical protein